MLNAEDIQVDTHLTGIEPSGPVHILDVKPASPGATAIAYEQFDGPWRRTR